MNKPCFLFAKGHCRFGEACRYLHNGVHGKSTLLARTSGSSSPMSDMDTLRQLLAKLGFTSTPSQTTPPVANTTNTSPVAYTMNNHPYGPAQMQYQSQLSIRPKCFHRGFRVYHTGQVIMLLKGFTVYHRGFRLG